MLTLNENNPFEGFSKLNRKARFERLLAMGALTKEDIAYLQDGGVDNANLAEQFIENVVGYFQLPLGVAANLRIDGVDTAVPMAVEETSIIAAISKTAKWIRNQGEINTHVTGHSIIGQIQISTVQNLEHLTNALNNNKESLIEAANEYPAKSLYKRGGGVTDMTLRTIARPDGKTMGVIHVFANTCDAMGANLMIQICEYLKQPIEVLTDETVTMCILSNLSDSKITHAEVIIRDVPADIGEKIAEASLFATLDPYRAATHNKGILNGMDPVIIATGNDWRAVEASVHAYACRDGQYRAVNQWTYDNGTLRGVLEAPIPVGIVGGVTRLHPTAQMSLRMLGVTSADELSRIVAAVGLVQNLGALRALITLGFTQGHMRLHITNLSLSAGANADEIPLLRQRLEKRLERAKQLTLTHAKEALQEIRREAIS